MLDQVIYTRSKPHIDLRSTTITRNEGYGVFSCSQEVFNYPHPDDLSLVTRRLQNQNASNETGELGLIHSYEYFPIRGNVRGISYEYNRPKGTEVRSGGYGHRSGNYIKQCFIGDLKGYPFEWFGSEAFGAWKTSENDYYLEKGEPEKLSQVSCRPVNGRITKDIIRQFAKGRENTIRKILWYLLEENKKPESQRRVLLIKDIPQNVELWIAAIELALSEDLAKEISFATNVTKLDNQLLQCLYYQKNSAGQALMTAGKKEGYTRTPYNLIVGYHPKDKRCSGVRPNQIIDYVVLDGETGYMPLQIDESILKIPYFQAVGIYNEDLEDFTNVVLPSLSLNGLSTNLPALYDAYAYLLDEKHDHTKWQYQLALNHLKVLTTPSLPNNELLLDYLVEEGLAVWPSFIMSDIALGLPFLEILWNMAEKIEQESKFEKLIEKIVNNGTVTGNYIELNELFNSLVKNHYLIDLKDVFKKTLFNQNNLQVLKRNLVSLREQDLSALSQILFSGFTLRQLSQKPYVDLIAALIAVLFDSKSELYKILDWLSKDPSLYVAVYQNVRNIFSKNPPLKKNLNQLWSDVLHHYKGNLSEFISILIQNQAITLNEIESILAHQLRKQKRINTELLKIFIESSQKLPIKCDSGKIFFEAWIEVFSPEDIPLLVSSLEQVGINVKVQENLFNSLSYKISPDDYGSLSSQSIRALDHWSSSLGLVMPALVLPKILKSLKRARSTETAHKIFVDLKSYKILMNNTILNCTVFADLIVETAGFFDPDLNIDFLRSFYYLDQVYWSLAVTQSFVKISAQAYRSKKERVSLLLSIYTAAIMNFRSCEIEIQIVQESFMIALKENLPNLFKKSYFGAVEENDEFRENIKDGFLDLAEEVCDDLPEKNPFSFVSKLFNKR